MTGSTNLQVVRWPVEKLIPSARNARTHSDEQIAQIAASIVEFGWTNPVLIGADAVVIAGHARLLAARKLGLDEVPVIVLGHLTPAQRRALVIADNQLAIGGAGWDEEMLRVELGALQEEAFNLELLGFSDQELEDLLREPEETSQGLTDDDAVPEQAQATVTARDELWVLGKHRLLCGDATEFASFEKVLAGEPPHLVFTDPPYNVNYAGGPVAENSGKPRKIANDNLGAGFEQFLREACSNILAVSNGANLHLHVVVRAADVAEGLS